MKLVSFYFDCGRSGCLPGFVAIDERGEALLNALVSSGADVYFGEVLGKHSEVEGPIEEGDYSILDVPKSLVLALVVASGHKDAGQPWYTINGYNPLAYYFDRNVESKWDGERYNTEPLNDAITRMVRELMESEQ